MALTGFPGSSVGKETACNTGNPSSIPGLGRSPGEGNGYPLQYSWASLVAQMVRMCLQCGRPGFNSQIRKIPRRKGWQFTPVFLPGESRGQRCLAGYSPWGHKESDTAGQMSTIQCLLKLKTLILQLQVQWNQVLKRWQLECLSSPKHWAAMHRHCPLPGLYGRDVTQRLQTHILPGQLHPSPSTCLRNGCLGDARHCVRSLLASFH